MANERVNTPIQTKYAEQLAADLKTNQAEQSTLTTRLHQLKEEEKWLATMLAPMLGDIGCEPTASLSGPAKSVSATRLVHDGSDDASVPRPRAGKVADGEVPVKPAKARKTAATGAAESPKGTLAQLLTAVLSSQPGEPKKLSEICTELEGAYPGRTSSGPIVRGSLERLVTKGVLEKEQRQGTMLYLWPAPEKASAPARKARPVKAAAAST
ncbi:hypothetical protein ACFXPT_39115 [Streptomyces goshikiensis]|uniref:hypothetical protein n=1 Tax=Streptomyces goshikiensis TaxID=1942 RepID=UPI003699A94E